MVKNGTKNIFTFAKLIKIWRKGKPPMSAEFPLFPNNSRLSTVKAIHTAPEPMRKLCLSTKFPHQKIR